MLFDGFTAVGKNTTQNYMQIMKSRTILSQVRDTVGLEEESLSSLEKRLTIQSVQGSDILQISMQSTDPAEAQHCKYPSRPFYRVEQALPPGRQTQCPAVY